MGSPFQQPVLVQHTEVLAHVVWADVQNLAQLLLRNAAESAKRNLVSLHIVVDQDPEQDDVRRVVEGIGDLVHEVLAEFVHFILGEFRRHPDDRWGSFWLLGRGTDDDNEPTTTIPSTQWSTRRAYLGGGEWRI